MKNNDYVSRRESLMGNFTIGAQPQKSSHASKQSGAFQGNANDQQQAKADNDLQLHLGEDQGSNKLQAKKKKKRISMRKYFLPVQATKNKDNIAKDKKGMFIVKWKKGIESLNIIEKSEDGSSEEKESKKEEVSKIKITRALRKQGYGKFQTYANFLDGEEKEEYEAYLYKKRKQAKARAR